MNIAIIGGGAAGFMAAITAKSDSPTSEVSIFEKNSKLLSKVKVSGGGRCNVTHACFNNSTLTTFYPRGSKFLKKAFVHFSTVDTVNWFQNRGVELKTESDNRMFPSSNTSQSIIDCLIKECEKIGVQIKIKQEINAIYFNDNQLSIQIADHKIKYEKIIIATGGANHINKYDWLKKIDIKIVPPVPSLFTFNMPSETINSLMGIVASNTSVRIQGTKQSQEGPLLITHWGFSGPAILKLSAFQAIHLSECNYNFKVHINWCNFSESEYLKIIAEERNSRRNIYNKNPFNLSNRLWEFLLQKVSIDKFKSWDQVSKKEFNKILNILLNDEYQVNGKTTFKEEFVTCGGVSLEEINPNTMEHKRIPNLFFCGEVLNIDGVTGGFNFQSAWTTGFLAGKNSAI